MVTYQMRQLCWFGVRLWRAIQKRKEQKAKEAAERKKGGSHA